VDEGANLIALDALAVQAAHMLAMEIEKLFYLDEPRAES
jgi:hypothetical protein